MAGEAGAAVLQGLAQNLVDLTKNQISLIYGLDGEAQNLIQNLDTIQQFLNDAETQTTIPSGAVKSWLLRLENAAFEADNVLDEIHYRDLSKTIDKKETVLISCFSFFIDYVRKRNSAVSIQKINMNLKSIHESATQLGLQQKNAVARTAPYAGMETDSLSADPIFIGRDEAVSEIVETLITSVATHHERVFSILPIVGMGGLGKTTLTRNVFHHQNMKTQFRSRIWVHVSQVFDPINLFNKILEALPSSQSDQVEISRQGILSKLEEALKDKTYLLVLDDVWNDDVSKWDDFLNSLLGVTTTKGNGIILTTRNTKVASIVATLPIHELEGLSEEDCWSIIRAKTFENEDVPLDFESIGTEIVKRCCGLPLAASVLGGVLRRDKSVDEWRSISQNWLSSEGEGDNNITKILRLSFNNLSSPSLKKCFAYCSIFPKGEPMEKQHLIEMWMGEGFLGSNEDMESVGDKFYNVLLHSSLLQVSKREEYDEEEYDEEEYDDEEYDEEEYDDEEYDEERCVMHDLVHDLASSVLGNADGVSRVRYLNHKEGESSPIKKEVAQHLRTLIFAADQPFEDNIFSDFKSLHVLILKGDIYYQFIELPRSISKLIHLRNLNITETGITHLPDWIGELHHLQTLRAEWLKKLPSTIKYLINLRHLHLHFTVELPAEIGRLTSLQTLWREFIVRDKNGYKIEELGSLNNLKGSLTIECLEIVHNKEEAEKANLFKKSKLSKLVLRWSFDREEVESINDENVLEWDDDREEVESINDENVLEWDDDREEVESINDENVLEWDDDREEVESINDENVLEGLQPHSNLKKLKIEGFRGKRFPEWTLKMAVRNEPQGSWVRLNQLVEIEFNRCTKCEEIPMLGHLPKLKSLKIRHLSNVKSINSSFYGIGNETGFVFPALEELVLYDMDSLEEWAEVESGSTSEVKVFPNLQSLKISNCNQLMKVPMLGHLPKLKSLCLGGLSNVKSINSSFYGISNETGIVFPVLETLELSDMDSLKEWAEVESGSTSEVKVFPNLQSLKISNCNQLMKVPMLGHLPKLKSLSFWGLRNVKSINSSFYGISNETGVVFPVLETLKLCDMDSLKEWAEVESGSTSEVKVFPNLRSLKISNCNQLLTGIYCPFLNKLTSLTHLVLRGPNGLKSLPDELFYNIPNLSVLKIIKPLEISDCNQLTTDSYLPLLSKLTSLTSLFLYELNGLESLPDELFYNNPNLTFLNIRYCRKLGEIPDGLQTLNSLTELIIEECPELKRVGCSSVGSFTSLVILKIRECHGLVDFPYEMVESPALWSVVLEGLSSLSNLPRVIECLAKSAASLIHLTIVGVPKFMATSVDQVWHFPNLSTLEIDVSMEGSRDTSVATVDRILKGCNSLFSLSLTGMEGWECMLEPIQHLTSVSHLKLKNFGMEEIAEWFDQFISHRDSKFILKLSECKRLRQSPSTHAMQRLIEDKRVDITDCPELPTQSDDCSE